MRAQAGQVPVGRPFPYLNVFTVYTTDPSPFPTPVPNDEDEASDQRVVYFESAAELGESSDEDGTRSEARLRRQRRIVGTLIGLQDFARMLGTKQKGQNISHGPTSCTRSVHSSKRRMVWVEPEPSWFVHATIELPAAPPRHGRDRSSASSASLQSQGGPLLEDDALRGQLSAACARFQLLNGSMSSLARVDGRDELVRQLDAFWKDWTASWDIARGGGAGIDDLVSALPQSPLTNAPHIAAQLGPLLSQFSASNPAAIPILLHGTDALHVPKPSGRDPDAPEISRHGPPPPLTQGDIITLGRYLAHESRTARPGVLFVHSDTSTAKTLDFPGSAAVLSNVPASLPATSNSKWNTYTLGMAGYIAAAPALPSLPTIPSMPGMPSMPVMPSLPGLPGMNFPSVLGGSGTPPTARSATATPPAAGSSSSSTWTLRKPSSWAVAFGSSSGNATERASAEIAVPVTAETGAIAASKAADKPTEIDASLGSERSLGAVTLPSGPTTPAVEVAPDVDSSALAEAMDGGLVVKTEADAGSDTPETASEQQEQEQTKSADSISAQEGLANAYEEQPGGAHPVKLFGSSDHPFEVRTYLRGPLTLALATSLTTANDTEAVQWLASRATRLLEAVETVLELVAAPPPPYPHRHLRVTGAMSSACHWPDRHAKWSGQSGAEAEDEIDAALFDCLRGCSSKPPILESFIRLSSSQWVICRREDDTAGPTMNKSDVYVVLPAKFGKEGSLVDAAEELRRYDRAYARE